MYNELAAKLPTEVWGEAGFRRLTVPRYKPAGGSEVDVHPRFCPPAVPSGKVLKRLRHGKAFVKSVKFCKQELYGRLGRVEVRRLHPLMGSTNPAGQVVLQCNWDVQCLHRCIVYQAQPTQEDGACGGDTAVCGDEAVDGAPVGSQSLAGGAPDTPYVGECPEEHFRRQQEMDVPDNPFGDQLEVDDVEDQRQKDAKLVELFCDEEEPEHELLG